MRKRILSLLLCIVMCLSLMPTVAFAAEITTVEATIAVPPTGSGPTVKTVTTDSSDYTVSFLRWVTGDSIESASHTMNPEDPDDIFRAGCTYYADIVFTPASGNTISDTAVAKINGKECFRTGTLTDGTNGVIYRYELIEPSDSPAIETLTATVTAPVAGAHPDFTAVSGDSEAYTTYVNYWCDGGTVGTPGPDMSSTDSYEAGKTYIVQVQFMPSVHKMFSESPSVSINGDTSVEPCGIQRKTGALSYRLALTVPASEEPPVDYPVWVNDERVSSANASDVLGDGKVSFEVKDGTPTLTILSGANITNTGSSGALIYSSMSDGLTINAPDGLTLSTSDSGFGVLLNSDNNLIINGNVNISTRDTCIDAPRGVTINGDATLTSSGNKGIRCGGDITVTGDVTVNAAAAGIESYKTVNVASGATWTIDASGSAITAKNGISIPDTSEIKTPTDGTVAFYWENYVILDSSNATASKVVIAPKAEVTTYPVWVSGIQVTDTNKDDVLGDGKVFYNPDTNTLKVLDGTNITSYNDESKYSLIYSSDTATPLTIDAPNGLTLYSTNAGRGVSSGSDLIINGNVDITVGGYEGYAVVAGGSVTIDGSAKLTITKDNGHAIHATKDVTINGDASITVGGANGRAINSSGSVWIKGNAEISGTSNGRAIDTYGNVQVDGNLTISGNFSYGINADPGTVTMATGKTWDIDATFVTIVGNSIELNGNQIKLPADGMIKTIDGCKVITESDGTTLATHVIIGPAVVKCTVTFNMNGHGTQVADQTVEEGTVVTEPTAPTAEGWTFGGWYTAAACTTAFDFTTPITADTTIYAKWTEILPVPVKHTISYDLNGGTMDGSTGIVTVDIEEGTVITLPAPTREGYVFDYWEGSKYYAGDSYTVTEDHTFTAQWKEVEPSNPTKPTEYTVTFNMNGHGTQVPAQTVGEGNKVTKPADPTASGYTFDGWYADATFSAAFDFDTAINADTTIYAKWTKETSDPGATDPQPATYTVTFNMNGHGTQVPAQTVEEGNKVTKPDEPSASGYTFDGWYADATFSAKFDFSSAINANTTVYAKWTEVKKDEPTKPADPTNPTQPTKPADPTSPQTGDNSHLFLWVALLFISGGALAGTAVYGKKRKYNAK